MAKRGSAERLLELQRQRDESGKASIDAEISTLVQATLVDRQNNIIPPNQVLTLIDNLFMIASEAAYVPDGYTPPASNFLFELEDIMLTISPDLSQALKNLMFTATRVSVGALEDIAKKRRLPMSGVVEGFSMFGHDYFTSDSTGDRVFTPANVTPQQKEVIARSLLRTRPVGILPARRVNL